MKAWDFEYDPNEPVDAEAWLSLEEEDKHSAVRHYHDRLGLEMPSLEAHAILHTIVENQIAEDTPEVGRTLARLMNEGLNRHQAVHALATVSSDLLEEMLDWEARPGRQEVESLYAERLKKLDADSWLSLGEERDDIDEDEFELAQPPGRGVSERLLSDVFAALRDGDAGFADEWEDSVAEAAALVGFPSDRPFTALQEAQSLVFEAWDEPVPEERIRLAERALQISADCADAYLLLAEEKARTLEEVEKLYRQGVEAGERALGPDCFEQDAGSFWEILQTRPYMRALFSLASVQVEMGKISEAIDVMQQMLHLNPSDNQGVRGLLAPCLFRANRDQELEELLRQFVEDLLPGCLYTGALLAYRQHGDCRQSRTKLKFAMRQNRYVPSFLLGKRKVPKMLSDYLTVGGPDEAADYAVHGLQDWRSTPGALFWLRRYSSKKKPR